MPLNLAGLTADLKAVAENPPATVAACAQAWADAVGAYASGVIPPSANVAAAKATLTSALAAAFATPAAAPPMEVAFLAFGTTVGLGMAPTFIAVPPAAPVGFVAQFAGPKPTTHQAAADAVAGLIDTWMKTGVANTVPPTSPVPWT